MKFKFKFNIGHNEIEIEDDVKDNKELLKKLAFYSELPSEGPTGNKDLLISHRTPKNYEYFSIIDIKAEKEFRFGSKQDTGELFAKGWSDAYRGAPREESPDLALNAKAIHDSKEVMRKEEPQGALNEVLNKYGLGK